MAKLTKDYNFAALHPDIAKEWHPTKNGDLKPNKVYPKSNKKVWWICDKGHEWKTKIFRRTSGKGTGCPKCSNQASMPELYIFSEMSSIFKKVEHRKKIDKMEVDIFINDINLAIEYDGAHFHSKLLKSDISKKNKLKNKASLLNVREYPLKPILKTDLVWTFDKNYHSLVKQILKHILTKFDVDKFEKPILDYLKEDSPKNEKFYNELISYLPGPLPGKSLIDTHPKIAKEWHPSKNLNLNPNNFSAGAQWIAWWVCSKGHSYKSRIAGRTYQNRKCPYCSGRKIGYGNDLKSKFPEIAKEWHPTKNGELKPENITPRSGKKVWWQCSKNHTWKSRISGRTRGKGCPECYRPNWQRKFYVYKDDKKIGEWTSQAECLRDLDLQSVSMISGCLNGKYKSYKGHTFRYAKDG